MAYTPNKNLFVTDDETTTFHDFHSELAGTTNSNMTKIDDALGDMISVDGGGTLVVDSSFGSPPYTFEITAGGIGGSTSGGGGVGKRVCRFTIGTSLNGWTADDCDYLCTGSGDCEVIQSAIDALPETGGEIVFLDGTYSLGTNEKITIYSSDTSGREVILKGNGMSSKITGGQINLQDSTENRTISSLYNLCFENSLIYSVVPEGIIENCVFINSSLSCAPILDKDNVNFVCAYNKFYITTTLTNNWALSVYTDIGNDDHTGITVIGNYLVRDSSSVSMTGIVTGGNVTIRDNTVVGSWNEGIYTDSGAICSGNILRGCDLRIMGASSACYNYIFNSYLLSETTGEYNVLIQGNMIESGAICVGGRADVIGNTVNGASGGPCVQVRKGFNNSSAVYTPSVIGNLCNGGKYGIYICNSSWSNYSTSRAFITNNRCMGQSSNSIKIESHWSNCVVTNNFCDSAISNSGSSCTITGNYT